MIPYDRITHNNQLYMGGSRNKSQNAFGDSWFFFFHQKNTVKVKKSLWYGFWNQESLMWKYYRNYDHFNGENCTSF